MATLKVFDEFFYHLVTGVHGNMNSGQTYKIMLTSTAPTKGTDDTRSDLAAGVVTGGSYADQTVTLSWAETGAGTGIWQLGDASSDVTFTASGSDFTGFRYAVLFNDTASSPADAVIAVLDYGSTVTVTDGNSFTVNAGASGWVQFTTPAW
jgi:hypothetical protein